VRRQLPKAYLRMDPNIDQHADPEGLVLLICAANRQARRGRFVPSIVERLLGRKRMLEFLRPRPGKEKADLIEQPDGTLYLDGWDEWQEGDLTVGERQARIRERRAPTEPLLGRDGAVTGPVSERSSASSVSQSSVSQSGFEEDIQSDTDSWVIPIPPPSVSFSEKKPLIQPPPPVPPGSRPECPSCGQWEYVRSDKSKAKTWFCWAKQGGCGHNWTDTPPPPKDRDLLAELRASGAIGDGFRRAS
jgi:hypothetical protein